MGSCKSGCGLIHDKKRFGFIDSSSNYDENINYNGHLVYCITNHMKTFDQNKVYEIDILNQYQIKIKGYKRYYDPIHFDFLENNEALFRQYQMNSVLDIDELKSDTSKRKIDRIDNKAKLLAKFLVNRLNTNASVDLENLISEVVSTNKAKYEVTTEDFKFLENLTFKELIDILK
jgi:hypothetical protein